MRAHQTLDKLEEKVYEMNHSCTDEEIDTEIRSFFEELITRKRDEPFGEGLQAGGVINPEKAGLKVAEKNGRAPHAHVFETVAQHLDGDEKYSAIEGIGSISSRKDDPHSWELIDKHGFTVRISVGKDKLIIIIRTELYNISLFQLKIIENIIKYARFCYQQGIIPSISINYVTRQDKFITNDNPMDDNKFNELENMIEARREVVKSL